jgi:hypothetical protein
MRVTNAESALSQNALGPSKRSGGSVRFLASAGGLMALTTAYVSKLASLCKRHKLANFNTHRAQA